MTRLRRPLIAAIAIVAGIVSFVLTWTLVSRGGTPLLVSPFLAVPVALAALGLIQAGRGVLKLKQRKPTRVTPTQAATIALTAHAAAIVGALLSGHMAAQCAVALLSGDSQMMREQAIGSAVTGIAGIVVTVIAVLVESWCIIDDDDDDVSGGAGVQASPA
ncbi:DUF3180 family protein [Nanchangia anserum]|uniref:DUF3180 family protein n=1 Tax=Nanchangia anserum TaxID=2692125 RepID=A0A8I0GDC2_9ACTO|nr:DUF3180 family protein [Nanchangia anserum]